MEIVKSTLHRDLMTDSYWAKVNLHSEKLHKETSVFLCASYEYLSNTLKKNELDAKSLSAWYENTVTEEIIKNGDSLFLKPNHMEVRAVTDEGYAIGLSLLQKKIA